MENYVFFIVNGKAQTFVVTDTSEIAHLQNIYGAMYKTLPEARRVAEQLKAEPVSKAKHYTDEERKQLEALQIEWGRSRLTEEEKKAVKESRKSIEQLQIEFGRMMMRKEMETCFA